jgi:hypothetical protein
MKTSFKISDILNSGDLYNIEDKIIELRYTIDACNGLTKKHEQLVVAKMQYELAILEDVKIKLLKK